MRGHSIKLLTDLSRRTSVTLNGAKQHLSLSSNNLHNEMHFFVLFIYTFDSKVALHDEYTLNSLSVGVFLGFLSILASSPRVYMKERKRGNGKKNFLLFTLLLLCLRRAVLFCSCVERN